MADIHVVTLRKPKDDVWACAERRCWTWKERLLGDGHDFFIPRPATTRRFCCWLRSSATRDVPLEEVAILGNCKRLDVYVALAHPVETWQVKHHVAEAMCRQMAWYQQNCGGWSPALWLRRSLAGFDLPESVGDPEDANGDVAEESRQLGRCLELRSGDAVSAYASSVAMALEGRTRAAFNPCSARESHIMLQLKRSLEAATGGCPAPCGRRLLCIWRLALEAGKALRSAAEKLPRAAQYAEAERLLAAQVAKCGAKLRGFRHGSAVVQLRAAAMDLLDSGQWEDPERARRRVQRVLHEPSVALKAGREVNETRVLEEVEIQLKELSEVDTDKDSPSILRGLEGGRKEGVAREDVARVVVPAEVVLVP